LTLVDTNILIDVMRGDPAGAPRSIAALTMALSRGPLAINDIVYAELAAGFATREDLDDALQPFRLDMAPINRDALALAGRTFRAYRQHGGVKTNVLPDFFIGAQAQVEGWIILTRDNRRFQMYFPDVEVVGP
jgi:predicted nucleic acid-binding protein